MEGFDTIWVIVNEKKRFLRKGVSVVKNAFTSSNGLTRKDVEEFINNNGRQGEKLEIKEFKAASTLGGKVPIPE